MVRTLSLYDRTISGGDAAVGILVRKIDTQEVANVSGGAYLEVFVENGALYGEVTEAVAPGAAVDFVWKVAVSDTDLAPGANYAAIMSTAILNTLTCRCVNDVSAKRLWRSSIFPIQGRFVYIWCDKDEFATDSFVYLSARLHAGDEIKAVTATGAVTSVAGRDGVVVLVAADVTDAGTMIAEDAADYVLAADVGTAAAEDVAYFTKAPVAAPAAANSTGVAGTWAYDATNIYICIATDTWVKATLATWP